MALKNLFTPFSFPLSPVAHSLVEEVDIFEYEAEERCHPLFLLLPSAGLTYATLKRLTVTGEVLYWINKLLKGRERERERERDDSWWHGVEVV